ncbi:hypothetical protein SAMN06272775_6638 [Streptomyces sp. 2323.1]|uniref:hypothetical protein n=1 Tax=Streptomyces sp. 2323.1 TaxID=1938841 RepID=UPI000BBF60D3|nr:hypothetical protein [Streptomyces sp. 2323.1]SOE15755.1 hypothetical protein SAMN06272775_6638 [Streptomyces sp. 2323.1]
MAHLLLVVVLALGVFVMHTVGHPDGTAGSSGHAAAGHTTGMAAMSRPPAAADTPTRQAPPTRSAHSGTSTYSATSAHSGTSTDDPPSHYAPGPGTGMNMASLCSAVLGTWALAILLGAALTRTPGWLADHLAKAVVLLRPNPPPRPPDLTRLSVLRI